MKRSLSPWWLGLTAFLLLVSLAEADGVKLKYDSKGNWIIADKLNNRILEIEPSTGTFIWSYDSSLTKTGTLPLVGPRDAERFKGRTLIVAGGLPAGVSPDYPQGFVDNRVFEVDGKGKIKWQYGQTGVAGAGDDELNDPTTALYMPSHRILITDRGNHRVIGVKQQGKRGEIDWQYGTTGVSGVGTNQLNSPSSAQRFGNGHYLIADTGNNRVVEVNKDYVILWSYGDPNNTQILNRPTYACKVPGGNILITDSGNNRILEIDKETKAALNSYDTAARGGSVADPNPTHAMQLKNGDRLICDQFNQQIIEIDPNGSLVRSYGTIGVSGQEAGLLNAPAAAKVVDDFTSLTPPKSGGGGGTGNLVGGF